MEEENEFFEYLVELRDSGETNMWGATPYLMRRFPWLNEKEATEILLAWMKSLK